MNFKIEGGCKLSGAVTINTSKNSAVALLSASLLNHGQTVLKRMPRIEEVNRLIEVLESIGVGIRWRPGNDLEIAPPKELRIGEIDTEAAIKTRSILMFVGTLIHRFTSFQIPHAGGCSLGKRTVRPHFYALEPFGVSIEASRGIYTVRHKTLSPATIVLYESGDTVTINALLAAAGIRGTTTLKMASANYQVQDVCLFLKKLGVRIEGIGSTTLVIHGVGRINKPIVFAPSEDPIEAMLFISIAATTRSALTLRGCPIEFLELELLKLEKMGFRYKILRRYKAKNGFTRLVDLKTFPSRLTALSEKIYARPFPGLNIDNLPFFVPIAAAAKGQTLIHDWVFENRAIYYLELAKLGVEIILADPHRVYITGPTKLRPAEIICPPALRPAAIIMIAMLAAKGNSLLRNVYSINRGYEDLAERLNALGARIEVTE